MRRVAIAVVIGSLFGAATGWIVRANGPNDGHSDFTFVWIAARAVAAGRDPYHVVAATVRPPFIPVLFYPLPAALIAMPFAWAPAPIAAAVFVAVECGLLAYVLAGRAAWWLLAFAAAPVWHCIAVAQWSPLLLAAALWAPLLGLVVAKPNVALPLLAMQTRWRAIISAAIGGGLLVLVALALQPRWPLEWLEAVRSGATANQYRVPMLTWWGLVLWLPILKWREPEARLCLGMACMPQNFFFYEQLPLVMVARSPRELVALALTSQVASLASGAAHRPDLSVPQWSGVAMPYVMAGLYLPALVLILRRPSIGTTVRA